MVANKNSVEFAKELDQADTLKMYREKFFIPQFQGRDTVYFTGNSLGLQPKTVSSYIQEELNDWAQHGVEGHFEAKSPGFHIMNFYRKKLQRLLEL
jgi:kynureninase